LASNGFQVSLDVGSRFLKLLVRDGRGQTGFEMAPRPVDEKELAALLRGWDEKYRLAGRPLVSSLSGPEINIQYLNFPALPAAELESAVNLEAGQILGIENLAAMDTDFWPLEASGNRSQVLFVACPQKLSNERLKLCHRSGLKLEKLTIDCLALANGYLNLETGGPATMLLNLGSRLTNTAVVEGGRLLLGRDILWGGERVAQGISEGLDQNLPRAIKILEEDSGRVRERLPEILDRTASGLIEEIEKTVAYCEGTHKVKAARLLLTGGASLIPGLNDFISERVSLPVQEWNAAKYFPADSILKSQVHFAAVAVGMLF